MRFVCVIVLCLFYPISVPFSFANWCLVLSPNDLSETTSNEQRAMIRMQIIKQCIRASMNEGEAKKKCISAIEEFSMLLHYIMHDNAKCE